MFTKNLVIKFEEEKDIDYIENIKIRFKDKELYYGNYKYRSNLSSVMNGRDTGTRRIFNRLGHQY